MILFDVKEMGRNLPTIEKLDEEVREVLALRILDFAVEIFNYDHRMNLLLGEAEDLFENDYDIMGVARAIVDQTMKIREGGRRCAWDPRIKVRLETRRIGRGFHQARVVMDLEETMACMLHEADLVNPLSPHVTDVVIDNPGIALNHEITRLYSGKAKRRTPLLSDRHPRAVKDGSWATGGSGHWERYGDELRQPFRDKGPITPTAEARLNSTLGSAEND